MPVQKFRNIEEMKATPPTGRGISLERRIGGLLRRSEALLPSFERPKGVFKFRTIEEMQAQRDDWEKQRVQAGRRRVIPAG